MSTSPLHRYYPPSAELPHFAENKTSVISLISQFGFLWAAVVGIALLTIRKVRPSASTSDKVAFVWMCLSMYLNRTGGAEKPVLTYTEWHLFTSGICPPLF